MLKYGMWDQVRVDHGKEFYLTLFMQELLSIHRHNQEKCPYLQTSSTKVVYKLPEILTNCIHFYKYFLDYSHVLFRLCCTTVFIVFKKKCSGENKKTYVKYY